MWCRWCRQHLYIAFSNTSNSQKHMHERSLLILAQHLTPFIPMSYWRKWEQWKSTLLSLNGTILFWLVADHNLLKSTEPIPSLWPQTQIPQGMHQFSFILRTVHKRLYIHNLWKLHCQICRQLQSLAYCLPMMTLTHTSLRWIDSQNSALTTSLN